MEENLILKWGFEQNGGSLTISYINEKIALK